MRLTQDFGDLADLLPEPLLLVESTGRVLAANRAAADLAGAPAASLAGRALKEFCLDDEQAILGHLKASSRSRTLVPGTLTLAPQGRAALPCRCEGAVYRPRNGDQSAVVLLRLSTKEAAVNQFVSLNLRITELAHEVARRRTVEAALRATTEQLRVTLASIGDAVIATDARGRVTFMNPVAEELTGRCLAQARDCHLDEVFVIVNEYTREPVESPVTKVLREGGIVGLANHTVLLRADGTEIAIDDSGAPIRDDAGGTIGVVLVFHDIRERHAMERELQRKTERLVEADRRKDEFLSMLAHELRNPLAPLKTGVQLLERTHGGLSKVRELANMMHRQLNHMVRLVDDLLDVSRVTRGTIELRRAPVRVSQVMDDAAEMSRPHMDQRGLKLSTEASPDDPVVDGDRTRLVQAVGNLLSNAAKFTDAGGCVLLRSWVEDDEVVISVRDTGTGIEPELLPKVFDLFVQGQRSLDRSQGGLGIGLTIVRSIVQMHGGSLEARSDGPGSGSEFLVRLPVVIAEGEDAAPASRIDGAALRAPAPLKVLVVDDNVDAAQTLCMLLNSLGYEADSVHGPEAALERAPMLQPDAMLLDIGLPGMNGYELARALRSRPSTSGSVLIAVTGYGDEKALAQSEQAGFDHHMTKPVDMTRLESVLAEMARKVSRA